MATRATLATKILKIFPWGAFPRTPYMGAPLPHVYAFGVPFETHFAKDPTSLFSDPGPILSLSWPQGEWDNSSDRPCTTIYAV